MKEQVKEILGMLEDFYAFVKREDLSGEDIYDCLKNYSDLVLNAWPDDLPDNGNWRSEMASVLESLTAKRKVSILSRSPELKSLKDDAKQVIHAINGKFTYYVNR